VDLSWENGKLVQAEIYSHSGEACSVQSAKPLTVEEEGRRIPHEDLGEGIIQFHTVPGKKYALSLEEWHAL
jgi:hypothetical protein